MSEGRLGPDSRLTPGIVDGYLSNGSWRMLTLRSLLSDAARDYPSRAAAIDYRIGAPEPVQVLTFQELEERTTAITAGLTELGIAAGDGVALMLPNCSEFACTIFATLGLGAVYTGIPPSYGERETLAILRRSQAKAIVIPRAFRSVDHLAMLRGMRARLPQLRHVIVLDATELRHGEVPFEKLSQAAPLREAAATPDPGDVCHIGFTSGTTGEPKGVMNSHQTLEAVMREFVAHIGPEAFGEPATLLVASPVGHHTGFLWGVLLGARLGGTAVYVDRWEPRAAVDIMRETGVTVMFGAPTFLQDLIRAAGSDRLPSFRTAIVAGAPVPRGLAGEARAALGCWVCPAWGMTEYGIGIASHPGLGAEALGTDGVPVNGCEVRIVDDSGAPVSAGAVGRLQIRGAGLFLGYRDRPDAMAEAFTTDGWFDTGDTAVTGDESVVTLRGRTKDIIIRGGENIPVTDIESLLYQHPDVVEAAVVGVPDARLGERAAAVVVGRSGADLDLEQVADFLVGRGLSRHYLPERLELVDELPKTSSGKIRKVDLREWITARAGGGS